LRQYLAATKLCQFNNKETRNGNCKESGPKGCNSSQGGNACKDSSEGGNKASSQAGGKTYG
jgi:hypothetical protein